MNGLTGYLSEFEGKKLQSISKGKIDIEPDNEPQNKEQEESLSTDCSSKFKRF